MITQRIKTWIERYLASDEAIGLLLIIASVAGILWLLANELAPVLAALVIAFVMQGAVNYLESKKVPQTVAIYLVYMSFLAVFTLILVMIFPVVWRQLGSMLNHQLPLMLYETKLLVMLLPERYPDIVSQQQALELVEYASDRLADSGQRILTFSLSKLTSVMALFVYLILVPLLVYFFLKDKDKLSNWMVRFLPSNRPKMTQIWQEMNAQVSNYIRGKLIEIVIVGGVSFVCFKIFGLNYAALLGLLVGLSVIVPYVGAVLVTIPVIAVAYLQFGAGGWGSEFLNVLIAYLIIQALDGNVLVPLLFSEAVNLHPVAIIVAILVFGGVWGFWGVFFAIPLATLIKALYNSWPEHGQELTHPV